jgi:purine-binding chemotaxis protein CheW
MTEHPSRPLPATGSASHDPVVDDRGLSPAEVQRLLRVRAEALAQLLAQEEPAAAEAAVLVFSLGGERYGLDLAAVVEVALLHDVTTIPGAPPGILGVVLHRGRVLAVVDLRPLLGAAAVKPSNGWVVVIDAGGMRFGLLADAVEGIRDANVQRLAPAPSAAGEERAGLVRGLTADLVGILDPAILARDPRIRADSEA